MWQLGRNGDQLVNETTNKLNKLVNKLRMICTEFFPSLITVLILSICFLLNLSVDLLYPFHAFPTKTLFCNQTSCNYYSKDSILCEMVIDLQTAVLSFQWLVDLEEICWTDDTAVLLDVLLKMFFSGIQLHL